MRRLPKENILYFGDTARAPYGHRTPSEVLQFTRQIVEYLLRYHPKMIVIACNTATAAALETIRNECPVPVVGVIEPGARAALKLKGKGIVGVLGTEGTIRSGAYEEALHRLSPETRVISLACPGFVPLVESGMHLSEEARTIVKSTLIPIAGQPMDALILGCTHYPYLSAFISEAMGPDVRLISSAEETASEVKQILAAGSLDRKERAAPKHIFLCSGNTDLFRRVAEQWLKRPVTVSPLDKPMISML